MAGWLAIDGGDGSAATLRQQQTVVRVDFGADETSGDRRETQPALQSGQMFRLSHHQTDSCTTSGLTS